MIEHILVSILFNLTRATLMSLRNHINITLRNDNNVARVKLKRVETSICPIINIKLSTPIFGLPMVISVNKKLNVNKKQNVYHGQINKLNRFPLLEANNPHFIHL